MQRMEDRVPYPPLRPGTMYQNLAKLCYEVAKSRADRAERDSWIFLGARFEALHVEGCAIEENSPGLTATADAPFNREGDRPPLTVR